MPPKKHKTDESILQCQCVAWFRWQYPKLDKLLIAIPNGAMLHGTEKQRAIQANRLQSEGAVWGAADLFLSIPSGDLSGFWIEMKTPKGRQSDRQKAFEIAVTEKGYGYAMPRSFEEFQVIVKSYLETGKY